MLNVEVPYDPGYTLGISAQRKADHALFDFSPGVAAFLPPGQSPAAPTAPLSEGSGIFAGLYSLRYGPTPGATWWDGDIILGLHVLAVPGGGASAAAPSCVARFAVPFANGSSLYVPPPFYSY